MPLDAGVGSREDGFSAGGPSAGHWWNSMLSAIEKGSLGNRFVQVCFYMCVHTHTHMCLGMYMTVMCW